MAAASPAAVCGREQNPGLIRNDALHGPAYAIGDHRTAVAHRLHRHEPEILLAGKQQRGRPPVVILDHTVRLMAQPRYARPARAAQPRHLRTVADHHERPSELPARRKRQFEPLVRRVIPHAQAEIRTPRGWRRNGRHLHGG